MSKFYTPPTEVKDGDIAYARDVNDINNATDTGFELVEGDFDDITDQINAGASKAQEWAEKAHEVPVEPGQYSALHWSTESSGSATEASQSAASALSSAGDASSSASEALANAALTASDVVTTNANVVLTNADAAQTAADVITTGAAVEDFTEAIDITNANVVITNADVVLTNADVVLTNADATATAADALSAASDASTASTSATEAGVARDEAVVAKDAAETAQAETEAILASVSPATLNYTTDFTFIKIAPHTVSTVGGPVSGSMPLAPQDGDVVNVVDYDSSWGDNSFYFKYTDELIMGLAEDMEVSNANASVSLIFVNSTVGWRLY